MYILWSRGIEALEFPMDIGINSTNRRKREDHSHVIENIGINDGTLMVQLLRADKLQVPEKYGKTRNFFFPFFKKKKNFCIFRDIKEIDVTLNKVPIPPKETTYWCHIQKLDDFIQQKHHIVQFEPIIKNEDIVHHMEVFHCETDVNVQIPLYNGDCDQLPVAAKVCNRVISLWAMGASAFTYPEVAGLPIGGSDYNPYIRLEVHFNNPELKSGNVKL